MGLIVHTSFQTPEGFLVTSVYCRIVEVILRPYVREQLTMSIRMDFYADRTARLLGRMPIQIPTLGNGQTYVGTVGSMSYFYDVLKARLEAVGLVVENVLEDPPPPLPETAPPAPPEEPPAEESPTEAPAPAPAEEPPAEESPTEAPAPAEESPTESPTEAPAPAEEPPAETPTS
jgi:hypothetical protein